MGKKPKCVKAVAYIRVSTGKQEISPEAQTAKIRTYCRMKGLDLVEVITEVVSAKKPLHKRPEGARISKLVEDGVCHIVATKLDRIFRSVPDASTTAAAWNSAGIALHFVDQQIDTSTPTGKCFFHMLASFAEMERDLIAERTSAALSHKKAHAEVYGHIPFGMKAEDGKLVPDAAEASTIAKMATWKAEGLSYAKIATRLNEAQVPTKQDGKAWGAQSVWNILKRLGS